MHILVIEDEKKILDFIKRGLKEEGYVVSSAQNGNDGFNLALAQDFDLIILDIMLPDMDGITICKKFRENSLLKPILMLTAKNSTKDKVMGLDSGADDYLTKPFAFEEFLARVRALLRKKNSQEKTKIVIDDLEIDLLTHEVKRDSTQIVLTSKEYALLEYLARNIGTIVTRTMISENVWDITFDSLTNVVDVYINYLRNKIDKGYDKKLIKTIRGRGYKIQI